MIFSTADWLILFLFFAFSLWLGLKYSANAGQDLGEFFLGGRKLSWWVAGVSMVATTFAADTPLLVAGIVAQNGISSNWLWWNMLLGGMLTTFFFARYWRRSGVLTEAELVELRYAGKPASFLRGFKAVYLGLMMNVVILAWVNKAMLRILEGFFSVEPATAILILAVVMLLVAIYSAVSGLLGVAITDMVQFGIAMIGCIILAILVVQSPEIGGIAGLKAKLPEGTLNFFPSIGSETSAGTMLSIGFGAFFARIGMQWWASWYPGSEPGGGGYVAQRMMSCKDEKSAVWATLFFNVAHYALRPWPWILVGLCSLVLYPELGPAQKEDGFVLAMRDYLPQGLRGLLLAAFFAAYMSTVSTQLNWGAGYLINDLYKRFFKPAAGEKELIKASRAATLLLMVLSLGVTLILGSIADAWGFIIECGAGLGLVLILRWYWWRINAWSEISATIAPFIAYAFSKFVLHWDFPEGFFLTIGFTTATWIIVTLLTPAEPESHLLEFYRKIRPAGFWSPQAQASQSSRPSALKHLFLSWISATALIYGLLFSIGYLILAEYREAGIAILAAAFAAFLLRTGMKKASILED